MPGSTRGELAGLEERGAQDEAIKNSGFSSTLEDVPE